MDIFAVVSSVLTSGNIGSHVARAMKPTVRSYCPLRIAILPPHLVRPYEYWVYLLKETLDHRR